MIAPRDEAGGTKASRELEQRRARKTAKDLPVIELTRFEFSTIRQVGSHEEIAELVKAGHTRLKMQGDCGNWFVCYPLTRNVFLVKFIRDRQRTKPGK